MIIYDAEITGSFKIDGTTISSIGSLDTLSGSIVTNSASIASLESVSGSYADSASFATDISTNSSSIASLEAASGSYADSSSFASERLLNTTDTFTGDLTVTGEVIAQTLNVQQVTSSIIYSSGSNQFGNSVSNTQQFTGSLQVSGSSHYLLGDVGIGITSPSATLHLDATGGANIRLQRTTVGSNRFDMGTDGTNMEFNVRDSGAFIFAGGNFLMGNTVVNPASGFADQTGIGLKYSTTTPSLEVSSDSTGLSIGRTTTGGAGTIADFRYESNVRHSFGTANSYMLGNVAIGTDSPSATFHVNGGEVSTPRGGGFTKFFFTGNNATTTYLELQTPSGSTGDILFSDGSSGDYGIVGYNHANDSMYFYANSSPRMFISGSGNVGIGTTSPSAKLDVGFTSGGTSLLLRNGDISSGTGNDVQIKFGFENTDDFAHFIRTRHNSSDSNNAIDFYTCDGTENNATFPTGSRLNLSLNSGKVGIGIDNPSTTLNVGHANHGIGMAYLGGDSLPSIAGLFTDNSANGGTGYGDLHIKSRSDYGVYGMFFHTAATNNVPEMRMVIKNDGSIGIGTTTTRARMNFPNIVDTNGYDVGTLRFYDNAGSIFYGIGVSDSQFNLRAGTTSDGFAFWAGTSHRMQIQGTTGNVGIGTDSPTKQLEVKNSYDGSQLTLRSTSGNSGNAGLRFGIADNTVTTDNYHKASIWLTGTGAGNALGDLTFNVNNNASNVNVSSADERLRILSSGGITFNGDTAAANALDDYEEGTFTPTVNSGTATTNWAKYTKIGDLVYIVCELSLTGTRSATTFEVGGLPFTNGAQWTPCAFYCEIYNSEGTQQVTGAFKSSDTKFRVINFGNEAIGTDFGNGYFSFSGTYKIN